MHTPEYYRSLEQVLNHMVEGYVVQDVDSKILQYNNAACKILGLSESQLLGKTSYDPDWRVIKRDGSAFTPQEHPSVVAQSTGKNQHDVVMGVFYNESQLRWISINSTPIFESNSNKPDKTLTTFRNITAQIEIEDALLSREKQLSKVTERLQLALDASKIGVWDLNLITNELLWDQGMYSLYGITAENFTSAFKAWENGLHPDDKNLAVKCFDDAIQSIGSFDTQYRVIWPSGDIKHVRAIAKVYYSDDQTPERMTGVNWDTTLEIEAQSLLEQAKLKAEEVARLKSEFLANMSHEIRTPLNGIIGMASLLSETRIDDTQQKMLDVIKSSGDTLLNVLNDILDLSKIEAGKFDLLEDTIDLAALLEYMRSLYAKNAIDKSIDFHCRLARHLPRFIISDVNRIKQILNNLICNALKFTSKGEVTLCIEKSSSGYLNFIVTDTGIGIENDQQKELFTAFTQADASITRKYGGTGLGLTISKRLADLLGGHITLTSAPRKGTRVCLTLPLIEAHETKSKSSEAQLAPQKGSLNIMIAEDNSVNQLVVSKMLTKLNHTISIATNGKEAVSLAKTHIFDLILMDVQMPELDGISATKIILNDSINRQTPIVAMTANVLKEDRVNCHNAGMIEFLHKPFTFNELALITAKFSCQNNEDKPL